MNCILFGGSGEVGGVVSRELIQSDVCTKLTLLGRKSVASMQNETKVEQVVIDTSSPNLEELVKDIAQGHDIAISCIGIGSGTAFMSEEKMFEIEVNMLGKYARGCKAAGIEIFELLTAVGVNENSAVSKIKALRVMGKKHKTVLEVGFKNLAIFKPGMIVGNAHTPKWLTVLTSVIPNSIGWGNIRQEDVAKAFVAHLEKRDSFQNKSVVSYENKDMKLLISEKS